MNKYRHLPASWHLIWLALTTLQPRVKKRKIKSETKEGLTTWHAREQCMMRKESCGSQSARRESLVSPSPLYFFSVSAWSNAYPIFMAILMARKDKWGSNHRFLFLSNFLFSKIHDLHYISSPSLFSSSRLPVINHATPLPSHYLFTVIPTQ